ncbi:MAG: hypothetical protein AAF288_05865 [Planctomycetota bacterium]
MRSERNSPCPRTRAWIVLSVAASLGGAAAVCMLAAAGPMGTHPARLTRPARALLVTLRGASKRWVRPAVSKRDALPTAPRHARPALERVASAPVHPAVLRGWLSLPPPALA